ncbi:hypothetical protein N2152v2_005811 [Parachlorella kessleri]
MQDDLQPAAWGRTVGPPPRSGFSIFTRVLQVTSFLLMATWIGVHLGGFRLKPKDLGDGSNDTSQLFNWHPFLISLAFPLFMSEAILSYRAPLYVIGFTAYLFPRLSLANRRALGPLHIFLGKAIYTLGMATMAVGIQEKATFIQLGQKPGVFAGIMRLPAVLELFLAFTTAAVLFHHSASPAPAAKQGEVETAEGTPRRSFETEPLHASDRHSA